MKRNLGLAALAGGIAWLIVNLDWAVVGQESFTGGQLFPVLNLLPAIALMGIFIARYRKFAGPLLMLSAIAWSWAAWHGLTSSSKSAAVVGAELERISGIQNAEDHMAGVLIADLWPRYVFVTLALVAILFCLLAIFQRRNSNAIEVGVSETSEDNRSLWDEQSS